MVGIPTFIQSGWSTFTTTCSAFGNQGMVFAQNNWIATSAIPFIRKHGSQLTDLYPRSLKFTANKDIGLAALYSTAFAVSVRVIQDQSRKAS